MLGLDKGLGVGRVKWIVILWARTWMVVTVSLCDDLKDSRHRKIEISVGCVHHIGLGSCSVRRYTTDLDSKSAIESRRWKWDRLLRVGLTELGSKVEFWAAAKLRRREVKRKVKESMLIWLRSFDSAIELD